MNNPIVAVVVVLVLIGGGFFLFRNMGVAPTAGDLDNGGVPTEESGVTPNSGTDGTDERIGDQPVTTPGIKEFSVEAVPFSFAPSTMTVNRGDTVKITLRNNNGVHDFKIDEFSAATNVLNTGQTQTITFIADKTGTFEYYCSVGNHRAMGMVGTLTVR